VAKKRTAARHRKQDAGLRRDVLEAIDRVWPEGVVDMTSDSSAGGVLLRRAVIPRILVSVRPCMEQDRAGPHALGLPLAIC